MFTVSKIIVLLSAALLVTAMPSGHHLWRKAHAHHGLAAREASPDPVEEPVVIVKRLDVALPRRSLGQSGRCGANRTSTPAYTPKSTPTSTPTSTPKSTPKSIPTSTPTSKSPAATPSPKSTSTGSSSDSSSGGVLSEILSGDATYYATGLGACGITNTDTDMIAAASELLFDTFPGYEGGDPNNNPICNKKVSVTYGSTTISVTITDRCTACAYGSLDFSPSAFEKLASLSVGRLHGIDWRFT